MQTLTVQLSGKDQTTEQVQGVESYPQVFNESRGWEAIQPKI
jgi:hypothetical protein